MSSRPVKIGLRGRVARRASCAVVRSRQSASLAVLMFCTVAGALTLSSGAAEAAVTHDYLSQITEVPASSGAALTGPLSGVDSLMADTGDLYVYEYIEGSSEARLDEFNDSSGAFVAQFAAPHGEGSGGVAVGHSTGAKLLYVGAREENSEEIPEGRVDVLNATGALLHAWTGAETPAKSFGGYSEINDVAVDNSTSGSDPAAGDVYVADASQDVVDVFAGQAGGVEKYVTQIEPEPGVPFTDPTRVAVDDANGDVLVVDGDKVDVFKPTAPGEYALLSTVSETPSGTFGRIAAVAVDGSDADIYVADEGAKVVDEFGLSGAYLGLLSGTPAGPFEELRSVAVDQETHRVYVGDHRDSAGVIDVFGPNVVIPSVAVARVSPLAARSATLNGTVNPAGAGEATCEFEYGTTTAYGSRAKCPAAIANGSAPVEVHAAIGGLQPDTTYHYRLQASDANGTNGGEGEGGLDEGEFATPGPGVSGESASEVTASSATLQAQVSPDGVKTTYRFEYGPSSAYGTSVPVPSGEISAGTSPVPVTVTTRLQNLPAGVSYHYRLVAESELATEVVTVNGPDEIFTTQPIGGALTLPDDRGFEMVSPVEKNGGEVLGIDEFSGGGIVQAAANGNAVTYLMEASAATTVGGTEHSPESAPAASQYLSTNGEDGWSTEPINTSTSSQSYAIVGQGSAYKAFSTELETGLEPSFTASDEPQEGTEVPPLSPEAPREADGQAFENIYVRNNPTETVQPLMTNTNSTRVQHANAFQLSYLASTPDLKHIILESSAALLPDATEAANGENLYEWNEGQLALVNVLPGEASSTPEAALGNGKQLASPRAIAANGSRVVFTVHGNLYMREGIGGTDAFTVQVDAAKGGPESGGGVFTTASVDGSRVFFTDTRRLTAEATAAENGPDLGDLYEFDAETGKLQDLTVDHHGDPRGADVVGVLGASENGDYVYFVANGVLAAGASPGDCTPGQSLGATCALYVERAGVPTFIATLSGEDDSKASSSGAPWLPVGLIAEDWLPTLERTVRVSGNGEELLFMSHRSLTGYDNQGSQCVPVEKGEESKDEYTPGACAEVYLYDASSARLRCVSCNPDGATPGGPSGIPGGTTATPVDATFYDSRVLSVSGERVFFDSADALVPEDTNHRIDVYEWEADGEGSCQSTADEGGCVFLISGGKSSEDSAFVDASENGEDVFFTTGAQLVPEDKDQIVDLYDARVGGGVSPSVAAPACSGTGCQGLPAATPVFATPASVTFAGTGNFPAPAAKAVVKPKALTRTQKLAKALKACAKDKRKAKRTKCEKAAHGRYGTRVKSKAKKSASKGGR